MNDILFIHSVHKKFGRKTRDVFEGIFSLSGANCSEANEGDSPIIRISCKSDSLCISDLGNPSDWLKTVEGLIQNLKTTKISSPRAPEKISSPRASEKISSPRAPEKISSPRPESTDTSTPTSPSTTSPPPHTASPTIKKLVLNGDLFEGKRDPVKKSRSYSKNFKLPDSPRTTPTKLTSQSPEKKKSRKDYGFLSLRHRDSGELYLDPKFYDETYNYS